MCSVIWSFEYLARIPPGSKGKPVRLCLLYAPAPVFVSIDAGFDACLLGRMSVSVDDLPNFRALIGGMPTIRLRRIWQQDFAQRLAIDADWRQQILTLEQVLSGVLPDARQALLAMVVGQIDQRNCERGWAQAFDLLNQARAYRYLADFGCREIIFLPGSITGKTPDLMAESSDGPVLCEVKTVHFTARTAGRTPAMSVRKLAERLTAAANQLNTFPAAPPVRRIVYFCLDFPGEIFGAADTAAHREAVAAFAATEKPGEIELVLDFGAGGLMQ